MRPSQKFALAEMAHVSVILVWLSPLPLSSKAVVERKVADVR